MPSLLEAAFSFPAVVFTVTSLAFLGVWVFTTAFGMFEFDADIDLDGDVLGDVDSVGGNDTDMEATGDSPIRSAMDLFGLTGMPIMVSVNVLSAVGWLVTMILVRLLAGAPLLTGLTGVAVSVAVLLVGFTAGVLATRRIALKAAPVFRPTPARRKADLVGGIAKISTGSVTDTFGQAKQTDSTNKGIENLVQVRSAAPNDLSLGDEVVLIDFNPEGDYFIVARSDI